MLRYKRLLRLIFSMMLICCMSITVCAQNVPDMSQKGNITVSMRYNGNAVSGGNLIMYKVATLQESNGTYNYVLTDDFAGSGVSLENIESADNAKTLSSYATKHSIKGTTQVIGSSGKASYNNLALGVYLFVQGYSATGYMTISPFLVSVPTEVNGSFVYNVNADPKLEVRKRSGSSGGGSGSGNSSGGSSSSSGGGGSSSSTTPTSSSTPSTGTPKNRSSVEDPNATNTPNSSSTTDSSTTPTPGSGPTSNTDPDSPTALSATDEDNPTGETPSPDEVNASENPDQPDVSISPSGSTDSDNPAETAKPKLPQTGQLNWPIPVLVVLGLGAFTTGWILRFGEKKEGKGKNNK